MTHNDIGISIFRIFYFSVKCWFTWEGDGAETFGNRCNSVALGEKGICDMR